MNHFQSRGGGDARGGGYRGGAGGGRPPFKKSWGGDKGGYAGGDKPMYPATCSKCNKPCEVPFRPMGGKPVFCRDCFNNGRDAGDTRGVRPDFAHRAPRPEFGSKPSFRPDAGASFKPTGDDTKKQLAEISIKLDRLINVVEKMNSIAKGVQASTPVVTKAPVEIVSESVEVPTKVSKKKTSSKKKKA